MTEHTRQILARQTFLDRNAEQPVELEIECLEAEAPPDPLNPAEMPWKTFNNYSDDELKAIFLYLQSLPKLATVAP